MADGSIVDAVLSSELRKLTEIEERLKESHKRLCEMVDRWKLMSCVVCPDCQRILSVYARKGTKEDAFEIWQERCSCKIDMAKIDRAAALWYKVKDLREQLAIPRHELLRITQSMTNDERIVFYKRVGV